MWVEYELNGSWTRAWMWIWVGPGRTYRCHWSRWSCSLLASWMWIGCELLDVRWMLVECWMWVESGLNVSWMKIKCELVRSRILTCGHDSWHVAKSTDMQPRILACELNLEFCVFLDFHENAKLSEFVNFLISWLSDLRFFWLPDSECAFVTFVFPDLGFSWFPRQ